MANVLACLLVVLVGCGRGEPFTYVPARGTVTYEDGSLIPLDHLVLAFHPEQEVRSGRAYPRRGSALVDSKTGTFSSVTSHTPGDGLIAGKYKVTLHQPSRLPLPSELVDGAYGDPLTTPLEIQGGRSMIELRIAKPGG